MKTYTKSIILILCVFAVSFNAIAQESPLVDKSALEDFKKGENVDKGVTSIVDYTIMKGVKQFLRSYTLKFNVQVETKQKVIVEVFDEEGYLVEVVYNDYMSSEEVYNFSLNKLKWDLSANAHYLRVTTDNFIENHEINMK